MSIRILPKHAAKKVREEEEAKEGYAALSDPATLGSRAYLIASLKQAEDTVAAAMNQRQFAAAERWKKQALALHKELAALVAAERGADPGNMTEEQRLEHLRGELELWPDEYLDLAMAEVRARNG